MEFDVNNARAVEHLKFTQLLLCFTAEACIYGEQNNSIMKHDKESVH